MLLDILDELGLLEQDLDERGPLALMAIDRREPLGRDGVVRIRGAHALVQLCSAVAVVELVLPGRGGLQQRLAPLVIVLDQQRALLEHVDRLLEASLALEQALERSEGAQIRWIDREHLAPRVDGLVGAAEHVFFELTEVRVKIERLLLVEHVLDLAELDDRAQRQRQLFPRLRGMVLLRLRPQRVETVAGLAARDRRCERAGRHATRSYRGSPGQLRHLVRRIGGLVDELDFGGFHTALQEKPFGRVAV